jgi:hypothetical protein
MNAARLIVTHRAKLSNGPSFTGGNGSGFLQPPLPGCHDSGKRNQLLSQVRAPGVGEPAGLSSTQGLSGTDPAELLQARDCTVQSSEAKPYAGEGVYIVDHCVPVLGDPTIPGAALPPDRTVPLGVQARTALL